MKKPPDTFSGVGIERNSQRPVSFWICCKKTSAVSSGTCTRNNGKYTDRRSYRICKKSWVLPIAPIKRI